MKKTAWNDESGMAIITAILVLMLASGLMAGMFAAVVADQRSHATDRDQTQAYAAAHAGLEKLTASLGGMFEADFSPSAAQLNVIDNVPPAITGFEYTNPGGTAGSGYVVSYTPDPGPGPNTGNPMASPNSDITTGPFDGLKGLITPYTLTVTAKSTTGASEVRLRREIQTVAVPVFQFGIFGEKSLGFHAGPNFDFGGRVHTNESLYLASGNGSTLTFRDKITAFRQVVRDTLSNGVSTALTAHLGTVSIPTVIGGPPASYRNLASSETSGTTATPCIGTASDGSACWSGWKNLSEVLYQTNIRTEATGAKALRLPLATQGAQPIDLIRRPAVLSNENIANAPVFGQRLFSQASVRILLSDRITDITNLPTVTAAAPVSLEGNWNLAPPGGYVVGAGRPSLAHSYGPPPAGGPWTVNATAGGGATLTINPSVPQWLRMNQALPNTVTIAGVNVVCTAVTQTQFQNCGAHVAFANAAPVTLTISPGVVATTTLTAAAAANSLTISVVSTANFFMASRGFWANEKLITCTGYNAAATNLTGCTTVAPVAVVGDVLSTSQLAPQQTSLIGGFLKIEKQDAGGTWTDVTMEMLNLGFAAPNQSGAQCADPTPNAVIRLQRLRDNGLVAGACAVAATNYSGTLAGIDYWPNNLYDAREGQFRTVATTTAMQMGGVVSYVALDVANLKRWLAGAIGATGTQALNNNGYIVYFSDRRGDHNEGVGGDPETGEYGFEDSINHVNAAWAKDNVLNGGEDFNENGTLQTYGESAHPLVYGGAWPGGLLAPFNSAATPWTTIATTSAGQGRVNRQVLFRRAIKIVNGGINGGINNLPTAGFTVASENPIYVQGDYNATSTSVVAEPNVPSALMADAVTLLSNAWTDAASFRFANDATNRNATESGYRFAMITGKSVPFAKPGGWGVQEYGSDGGVHNFMRMLEDWSGQNLRYRGSMVSLFFSRQAVSTYRADANIYSPPTRGYNFDTDFLTPILLPPGTPMFRDVNTLKFRQILRPNQ
jgi:hypothetical protein